jgi:hypothetical protein
MRRQPRQAPARAPGMEGLRNPAKAYHQLRSMICAAIVPAPVAEIIDT